MNLGTQILRKCAHNASKIDFTQLGNISPQHCPVFSNCCYVPESQELFVQIKPQKFPDIKWDFVSGNLCGFIYPNNPWFSIFSGRNREIFKVSVPMIAGVYYGTWKEIIAMNI